MGVKGREPLFSPVSIRQGFAKEVTVFFFFLNFTIILFNIFSDIQVDNSFKKKRAAVKMK